jgi:hypothetical protein
MVFATRVSLFASHNRRMANMPAKYGNLQYYKGTGGTSEGRLTSKGKFLRDWTRMKFIMSPGSLQGFPLKPYVARTVRKKD